MESVSKNKRWYKLAGILSLLLAVGVGLMVQNGQLLQGTLRLRTNLPSNISKTVSDSNASEKSSSNKLNLRNLLGGDCSIQKGDKLEYETNVVIFNLDTDENNRLRGYSDVNQVMPKEYDKNCNLRDFRIESSSGSDRYKVSIDRDSGKISASFTNNDFQPRDGFVDDDRDTSNRWETKVGEIETRLNSNEFDSSNRRESKNMTVSALTSTGLRIKGTVNLAFLKLGKELENDYANYRLLYNTNNIGFQKHTVKRGDRVTIQPLPANVSQINSIRNGNRITPGTAPLGYFSTANYNYGNGEPEAYAIFPEGLLPSGLSFDNNTGAITGTVSTNATARCDSYGIMRLGESSLNGTKRTEVVQTGIIDICVTN